MDLSFVQIQAMVSYEKNLQKVFTVSLGWNMKAVKVHEECFNETIHS